MSVSLQKDFRVSSPQQPAINTSSSLVVVYPTLINYWMPMNKRTQKIVERGYVDFDDTAKRDIVRRCFDEFPSSHQRSPAATHIDGCLLKSILSIAYDQMTHLLVFIDNNFWQTEKVQIRKWIILKYMNHKPHADIILGSHCFKILHYTGRCKKVFQKKYQYIN